jgi:aminoglycoside phosphotransferase (APT) family kinase protein
MPPDHGADHPDDQIRDASAPAEPAAHDETRQPAGDEADEQEADHIAGHSAQTSTVQHIGSGRAADVYAIGDGLVLRRYRGPGDTLVEAAVMQHVRTYGFPAPDVAWASGGDIAMERIDGSTMLADVGRRPWKILEHARTLADLHHRLEQVPAAPWMLPRIAGGPCVVHLDLHPENVMLSKNGPVVIDWSNAGAGQPGDDAAQTWAIMHSARIPVDGMRGRLLRLGRSYFVGRFLRRAGIEQTRRRLADAIAHRLGDRNLFDDEREILRRLAERQGGARES